MAILELPGGALDVVTTGSGPDLVLLHSLLIDRSAYDRVVPSLATQRRVHLVALPGFDASSAVEPDVDAYADRIAEGMRALRLPKDTAVLGNGFGGFVAVALAARHGADFGKLLLIDTGAGFPPEGKVAFRVMAEKVRAGGMAAIAEIAARRIFHDEYLAAHPAAIGERRAVLERFDPAAFAAACGALENVDLRPHLGRIRNKTLVVVGALDQATPPALGRVLAAGIPFAELVELPRCGHCPMLEQPEVFLATIAPFLVSG